MAQPAKCDRSEPQERRDKHVVEDVLSAERFRDTTSGDQRHQVPQDTANAALLAFTLVSLMRWLGQNSPAYRRVQFGILLSVGAL